MSNESLQSESRADSLTIRCHGSMGQRRVLVLLLHSLDTNSKILTKVVACIPWCAHTQLPWPNGTDLSDRTKAYANLATILRLWRQFVSKILAEQSHTGSPIFRIEWD